VINTQNRGDSFMANKLKTKAFKSTCFIAITTALACALHPIAAIAEDDSERYHADITSLATCLLHHEKVVEAMQKTDRRHADGGKLVKGYFDFICLKASELVEIGGLSWPAAVTIEKKRVLSDLVRKAQMDK